MAKPPSRLKLFFDGVRHSNFRRLAECATLLRWLAPAAGERILDIGCGDGYYDALIAKSGAKVTGIDLHEKRLARARRLYASAGIEFHTMDAANIDLPGPFDKAVSLCVIEHLADDERVLCNVFALLKPQGELFFSADSFTLPAISDAERTRHRRRYAVNTFYTKALLEEKLRRNGFTPLRTQYLLSGRLALALIRFTWRLDDLPRWLFLLRLFGYVSANLIWAGSRPLRRIFPADVADGGLCILVQARKNDSARARA